ncbi:MAG TPA: Ig-like domain-containing protein, partial [Solirubrobacteraceae bacterium]|nr:Ig-like domain-containing protein [Solirubrobacteraceae bacterium]
DAFNQIFYSESSNGKEWSVPKVVLSTEYEFKASREQDEALADHIDAPLGISAYYSGRAYGPTIVQNPNGTLTMVFSGYRLPKPVASAGTKLGTDLASQYTVSEKDPTLYRNILTMQLTSATSPGVATETSVSASDEGTGTVGAPVTYTATVVPVAPGAGTPTGKVAFSDGHGSIAGCSEAQLDEGSPDTATCTTAHESPAGSVEVTATYAGDSNYAGSSGHTTENVQEAPAIDSGEGATFTEGAEGDFEVTATGTPSPTITESGTLPEGVGFDTATGKLSGTPIQEGVFQVTFEAANGVGSNAVQHFTLTVDAPPAIDSPAEATFDDHVHGEFTVTATGTPAPTIAKWGYLPEGVSFTNGVLSGTPTQTGTFEITFTAENGIGPDSVQMFTLKVLGLHVTTSSLPEVTPGVHYSEQLQATGGIAPYKWKRVTGQLPKGLKLSKTGLLSGTVSARKYPHGGTFPITVKATDSTKKTHQTATASLTVTVS